MPFQKSKTDKRRPVKMELRVMSRSTFQLITGFAYQPAAGGDPVVVPPHDKANPLDTTDLASVPRVLWGLLASYGRQLRAALMHDHLCDEVNRMPTSARKEAYAKRRRADELFRLAMRDPGAGTRADIQNRVTWFRSWLFWAGVTFGRYWDFRKVRTALLVVHVLLGTFAFYASLHVLPLAWLAAHVPPLRGLADHLPFGSADNPVTYLSWFAVALVLSVLWWRDWRLPFIGLVAAPVVLPVFAVTMLAQLLIAVPDFVASLGPNQPRPYIGPALTVRAGKKPPSGGLEGG